METLLFTLGNVRGVTYYYPANDLARATLPKGRRALMSPEVVALLIDERDVVVDLRPFLGRSFLVRLDPVTLSPNDNA